MSCLQSSPAHLSHREHLLESPKGTPADRGLQESNLPGSFGYSKFVPTVFLLVVEDEFLHPGLDVHQPSLLCSFLGRG